MGGCTQWWCYCRAVGRLPGQTQGQPCICTYHKGGREGRKEMKGMLGVKSHVNSTEYSDVALKASQVCIDCEV